MRVKHRSLYNVSLAAVVLILSAAFTASAYASEPSGLVEVTSHNSFGATVTKLESAVGENGLMILKKFNQQMMLNMVGMHAQKGMSFEIFHPRFGKTIYNNNPVAFLAAPLRILVLQKGSAVNIYYIKPSAALDPYGLSDLGGQLDPVFQTIVAAAAK